MSSQNYRKSICVKRTTFITSECETSGKNKVSSVKIKNPSKYYVPARKKSTGPMMNIVLELCKLMQPCFNEKQDFRSMVTFGPYVIPVPKSGHLTMTDNYRGISLTCILAKMFNRMMLNRLRPAIDPLLRNNQNGFREGRSTTSQILALRRLIEEVKLNNLSAVITFIDLKKLLTRYVEER